MATNVLSTLIDRLSQNVGDYFESTVTTALTTSTSVVCTPLGNYRNRDGYFARRWLYVTDYANIGEYRKVSTDTASTNTLVVLGSNFSSDTANLATFQLHRYDRNNKIRAINKAARQVYSYLFRLVRNQDLISNNILPNASFEDWSVATYPDYWTNQTNLTSSLVSTTAGTYLFSGKSVAVKASANNGYLSIKSDTYPQLLDLMGKSVSLYCWAQPGTANDAAIVIYTKQADGTAQTLTSTTASPAGEFALLKLEDQTLNDDLVEVEIRLKVATSGGTVYFDNARLYGTDTRRYVLPLDFQNPMAEISSVSLQNKNVSAEGVDDHLAYAEFVPIFGWFTTDDATTKYLITPVLTSKRIIQIEGVAPLESNLSAVTDTMTIEDPHLDLLIEKASSVLMDIEAGLVSGEDRTRLLEESTRYLASYEYMAGSLRMSRPKAKQRIDARLVR